jgi:hypothetical protein
VDLFSKKSIDAHFDTHLTRVIKALKPYISRTFYGFEIDSYELGMVISPNFEATKLTSYKACRTGAVTWKMNLFFYGATL